MNFINKFFNKPKIDCPRCLGKGEVDWDDIRRLKKELKWLPGKCAYCNGHGKIPADMVAKVAVDNTYLTIDILEDERQRLIDGNEAAIQRANEHETQLNDSIAQIEYLHFVGGLDAYKIADFYLLPEKESGTSPAEKQELLTYIEKVITNKTGK